MITENVRRVVDDWIDFAAQELYMVLANECEAEDVRALGAAEFQDLIRAELAQVDFAEQVRKLKEA